MGQKNRIYVDIMSTHPEVTGSCILCIVKYSTGEKIKFVVDCGLFQEEKYDKLNTSIPFNPEELDFILVTHNHTDHIGRLPFLENLGFYKNIYTTKPTRILMKPALENSCKVLGDLAKRNHTIPLYDYENVERTLSLVKGCDYNIPIEVVPNVKVTFFPNGHLPGAAIILVQISSIYSEDINILFTGDYNNKNVFFDVPELPNWVFDLPLTVIQESTYGNTKSTDIQQTFEPEISEAVEKNKNILIPVFSLNRAQEILYKLKQMQDSKTISSDYPIYLDGALTQTYTNIYQKCDLGIKEDLKQNFLPANLKYILSFEERLAIISAHSKPKIVVTSSGMASHGPAQMHIPTVISHKNGFIHFTGYTAKGTLGYRLQQTQNNEPVSAGGLIVNKLGEVKNTNEFSSHAKSDEMIEFLKKFNNLKLVLINHGEKDTKECFALKIMNSVDSKNIGILGSDYLFRINPYGLVKTMGTKFNY